MPFSYWFFHNYCLPKGNCLLFESKYMYFCTNLNSKIMELAVWIIQGILALMFLMAGIMKSTQPKDKLVKSLPWVNDYSLQTVRFIGISELTGAIGIIIPQITGILPILSPIAAVGLVIIMILAASHHFRKNEFKEVAFNAVLLVLSAIVAYYRF
jgi:uncharacterized membrane protein YphA (DoxX/SURF4 family)